MNLQDAQRWAHKAIDFAHYFHQQHAMSLDENHSRILAFIAFLFLENKLPKAPIYLYHFNKIKTDLKTGAEIKHSEQKFKEHYFVLLEYDVFSKDGVMLLEDEEIFEDEEADFQDEDSDSEDEDIDVENEKYDSENEEVKFDEKGLLVCYPLKFLVIESNEFKKYLKDQRFYKEYITQTRVNNEIGGPLSEEDKGILNEIKTQELLAEIKKYQPTNDFQVALSAMIFSKEIIKWSNTQLGIVRTQQALEGIQKEVSYLREQAHGRIYFLRSISFNLYKIINALNTIHYCQQLNAGNCFEFSLLGLFDILKNKPETLASMYHVNATEEGLSKKYHGDHVALLVGNFICDAWEGKIYPKEKEYELLNDCFNFEKNDVVYQATHKINKIDYVLKKDNLLNTEFLYHNFFSRFKFYSGTVKDCFLERMWLYIKYVGEKHILQRADVNRLISYYLAFRNEKITDHVSIKSQLNFYFKIQSRLDDFDDKICEMIVKCGCLTDQQIHSFLGFMIEQGNLKMVDFLLDYLSVDVNFKNNYGNSLLHLAVMSKNLNKEIIKVLIKNGADLNLKNKFGHTALNIIRTLPETILSQSIIQILITEQKVQEEAAKHLIVSQPLYTSSYLLFSLSEIESGSCPPTQSNIL